MKKIIMPLILALLFIGVASAYECYQDHALYSSSCGGKGNGNYLYEGLDYGESCYDDWWTDAVCIVNYGSYVSGGYWVNYTKPDNSVSAMWEIGWYNETGSQIKNFSVPSDCFDAGDYLQFQVESFYDGDISFYGNWSCYNGSSWNSILQQSDVTGQGLYYLEEAVIWNISGSLPIPVFSILYPENQAYNLSVLSLNYTLNYADSCWYSINGQSNTSIKCYSEAINCFPDGYCSYHKRYNSSEIYSKPQINASLDGNYTFMVYGNNSDGIINSSLITFSIATSSPSPSPSPSEEGYDFQSLMLSAGEGLGAFLDAVRNPLVSIVLGFSVVIAVAGIIFALVRFFVLRIRFKR